MDLSWTLVEDHLSRSLKVRVYDGIIIYLFFFWKRDNCLLKKIICYDNWRIIFWREWFTLMVSTAELGLWWRELRWMDEECFHQCYFMLWKLINFMGQIYYWVGDGSDVEAERETWKRKAEKGKADDRSFQQCYGSIPFFSFCAAVTSNPVDKELLPLPSLQINKDFLGNKNFI